MFDELNRFSDRIALISDNGAQLTFGELLSHGDALVRCVSGRCLVISFASNSPDFVAGYVGFMRAGFVQLLVNETIAPEFLSNLVELYSPEYVYLPAVSAAKYGLDGRTAFSQGKYDLIATGSTRSYELYPDLALLLSTSGSTGSPKLVRISRKNIQSNTDSIIQYLGLSSQDRAITTMPLSYSYGLSILNTHLVIGASIVMTDSSVMSRGFWELLKEHSVTNFGGVPYIYEMLKKLRFGRMDLPSLRMITQAGGKLSTALAEEFAHICLDKKIRFYVMYGQTEATARMSYLCLTDHPNKAGSIGKAIPGGEFWLMGSEGERISERNTSGELVYSGPNVSMGFAESGSDLARSDTNQGILKTGDVATVDEDGYFYIVGRKNQFLKIFGIRVNLLELEEVLKSKGCECACWGSDEKLFIYLTQMKDREKLELMISELTGIHKSGFELVQIDEIPRTDSGKVLYNALEALRA